MKVQSLVYVCYAASLAAAFPFSFAKRANETCPMSVCALLGWEMHLPGHDAEQYWSSRDAIYLNNNACGRHCAGDEDCKTYSIGEGSCRHYKKQINETMLHLLGGNNGTFAFYDQTCQNCPILNMTSTAPYANKTSYASQPSSTAYIVETPATESSGYAIKTPEPYRPGQYWSSVHHVQPSPSPISPSSPASNQGPSYDQGSSQNQGPSYGQGPSYDSGSHPDHHAHEGHQGSHASYVKGPPKGTPAGYPVNGPKPTAPDAKPPMHAGPSKPCQFSHVVETLTASSAYQVAPSSVPATTVTPGYPQYTPPTFSNGTLTTIVSSSTLQLPSDVSTPGYPVSNSTTTAVTRPTGYVVPALSY